MVLNWFTVSLKCLRQIQCYLLQSSNQQVFILRDVSILWDWWWLPYIPYNCKPRNILGIKFGDFTRQRYKASFILAVSHYKAIWSWFPTVQGLLLKERLFFPLIKGDHIIFFKSSSFQDVVYSTLKYALSFKSFFWRYRYHPTNVCPSYCLLCNRIRNWISQSHI